MDKPLSRASYTFFDRPIIVRRPANRTAIDSAPVLAAFDPDNAVVWANDVLGIAAERNRPTRRKLRDEDTETLAHEFARVLQYRDILEEHGSHADRVAALRRWRTRAITRSTSESYANKKLLEERRAEETVQRIRMEILNSFDRSQKGAGLAINEIGSRAEESAADFVQTLRDDYYSSARREFARLHAAMGSIQEGPGLGGDDNATGVQRSVLNIGRIRWLFPTELSPTLADLINEMVALDIRIVISGTSSN